MLVEFFRVCAVMVAAVCWCIGVLALTGIFAHHEIDVQLSLGVTALGWFAAGWLPYRLYKD